MTPRSGRKSPTTLRAVRSVAPSFPGDLSEYIAETSKLLAQELEELENEPTSTITEYGYDGPGRSGAHHHGPGWGGRSHNGPGLGL